MSDFFGENRNRSFQENLCGDQFCYTGKSSNQEEILKEALTFRPLSIFLTIRHHSCSEEDQEKGSNRSGPLRGASEVDGGAREFSGLCDQLRKNLGEFLL